MNKNLYIVIGVVAVALLLLCFSIARTPTLGGLIHNVAEQFVQGIKIGDTEHPGCIKIQDRTGGEYSFIYILDGVVSSTDADIVVPDQCSGL